MREDEELSGGQCDQIGRFFGLWTTFQSLWQQLICANLLHSQAIFVKESKSVIFLVKSFLGNFYRHLANFFWSHLLQHPIKQLQQPVYQNMSYTYDTCTKNSVNNSNINNWWRNNCSSNKSHHSTGNIKERWQQRRRRRGIFHTTNYIVCQSGIEGRRGEDKQRWNSPYENEAPRTGPSHRTDLPLLIDQWKSK